MPKGFRSRTCSTTRARPSGNGNTVTMDGFVAAGLRMIQCDYPALMDEYLRDKGKR